MKSLLVVCVVAAALLGTVHSQTCSLPTASAIGSLIAKILNSGGGEGAGSITVNVISYHFTCIAVGPTEGTIRFLSAPVEYQRNSSGTLTTLRQQFQFSCSGDVLNSASSMPVEMNPPPEAFIATTRRDCFTCSASTSQSFIDQLTNCAICTACENEGQGFCTGQSTCCPFFQGENCVMSCTDNRVANAATNFTCVCMDGFAENGAGMCVDVCDPNPCQNGGTCAAAGNSATCNCPMGYTGANCDTVVVPEPSSTPTPSPTPVTSPPTSRPCTVDNCQQCNSAGCCIQCENRFELMSQSGSSCPTCVQTVCSEGCRTDACYNSTCCRDCLPDYELVVSGNTCTCNAKPTEPPVCSVPNCTTCNFVNGRPCCSECQPGFGSTEDDCRCLEIRVPDSAAVAAGIAVGVVLFVLLLLALAILAAYIIYAVITHGTDSKRTKSHMPFGNGDAHDNPLYINPKELDDDEP